MDNSFPNFELPWEKIYMTARKATTDSNLCCFIYKTINTVLYFNKSFFNSVRLNLLRVLFVILKLNQQSMFFINVQLHLKVYVLRNCFDFFLLLLLLLLLILLLLILLLLLLSLLLFILFFWESRGGEEVIVFNFFLISIQS